jgi:hypothetical protein
MGPDSGALDHSAMLPWTLNLLKKLSGGNDVQFETYKAAKLGRRTEGGDDIIGTSIIRPGLFFYAFLPVSCCHCEISSLIFVFTSSSPTLCPNASTNLP